MIKIKKGHENRFHEYLGIPAGKPIPMRRVLDALKSGDSHVRRMANFARNAKKWSK